MTLFRYFAFPHLQIKSTTREAVTLQLFFISSSSTTTTSSIQTTTSKHSLYTVVEISLHITEKSTPNFPPRSFPALLSSWSRVPGSHSPSTKETTNKGYDLTINRLDLYPIPARCLTASGRQMNLHQRPFTNLEVRAHSSQSRGA